MAVPAPRFRVEQAEGRRPRTAPFSLTVVSARARRLNRLHIEIAKLRARVAFARGQVAALTARAERIS